MKRSLDPVINVQKTGPKTSDNSTSTGTGMKKVRKDVTRAKHLRRGASHASSAQEHMKSEWTCDELDLTKQLSSLLDLSDDKFKLIEEMFSIFTILELKSFTPEVLKEYSVNQLKEMCLEELNTLSASKIKWMCTGNAPEDYAQQSDIESKDKNDPILQLSVDHNEYSDFLGSEGLHRNKSGKQVKDAAIQANESSFESSSDDEVDSDGSGVGWMNIFAKTQMEILELEMRARAIRKLLKEEEDNTEKTSTEEMKHFEETIESEKNEELDSNDSNTECHDLDDNEETKPETKQSIDEYMKEDSKEENFKQILGEVHKDLNEDREEITEEDKNDNEIIEEFDERHEVIEKRNEDSEKEEILDESESKDEINKKMSEEFKDELNENEDKVESKINESEEFDDNVIRLRIDSTIDFDEELEDKND